MTNIDHQTLMRQALELAAVADRVPARELRHCLALALTHHLRKKKRS